MKKSLVDQIEASHRQIQRKMTLLWSEASLMNLTLPQVNLLILLEREGKTKMSDFAEILCTSPGNLSILCDKLLDKGLIDRERDDVDRRMVYLQLSEEGKRMAIPIREAKDALVERAMSGIDADELGGLIKIYKKIIQNLNS